MTLENLALQGNYSIYTSMAAGIAGRIYDLRKESIKESLSDFHNVEHRLEFVSKVHGIEFINDSKASNVNSTWYALESMNRPVIWIAGGVDKDNDYSILHDIVKTKVKAMVCLGIDNSKMIKAFRGIVPSIFKAKTAEQAVEISYNIGEIGDIVLLSPGCASFDLFENYEERGRQFKQAVYNL